MVFIKSNINYIHSVRVNPRSQRKNPGCAPVGMYAPIVTQILTDTAIQFIATFGSSREHMAHWMVFAFLISCAKPRSNRTFCTFILLCSLMSLFLVLIFFLFSCIFGKTFPFKRPSIFPICYCSRCLLVCLLPLHLRVSGDTRTSFKIQCVRSRNTRRPAAPRLFLSQNATGSFSS
jgi:hypothetical protein